MQFQTPSTPSELLYEIQRLLELRGESSFRVRAYEKAAKNIAQFSAEGHDLVECAKAGTLREIAGVGKGIEEILQEYLLQGKSTVYEELRQSISPALLELTQLSGLGPKKAGILIDELGINSIGELEYACKENRLINLKGFGVKAQQKIMDEIALRATYEGYRKLSDVWDWAEEFRKDLIHQFKGTRISETGDLRRRCEVLLSLDYLVECSDPQIKSKIEQLQIQSPLPIRFHFAEPACFGYELARTTGSEAHWNAIGAPVRVAAMEEKDEESFYNSLGLPCISPEMRETGEEVDFAKSGHLKELLPWNGIRGVFHNHTIRSDGSATLEEMVVKAEKLGFEYIGISDHSQSAFYAQGLKNDVLEQQFAEVQEVQARHPKVRIFWGIESDILADGSLDYDPETLGRFDFVIASIHMRFNMDGPTMTERVLKAIRNPATRFLGHPTGRLLLGRKPAEMDMVAIIREAARCNVAIELNANPNRLDLDWRWGAEMRKHRAWTSVNPDAHESAGLEDATRYGVVMARKALFPTSQVVNAKSTSEVERWLRRQ